MCTRVALGGLQSHSPASVIPTVLGLIGGRIPSFNVTPSYSKAADSFVSSLSLSSLAPSIPHLPEGSRLEAMGSLREERKQNNQDLCKEEGDWERD